MKLLKLILSTCFALLISSCACRGVQNPVVRQANATKLPSSFPVYINNEGVAINHPAPGYEKRILPTDSSFGYTGCYVACYSRDPNDAVYGVGNGIYVKGQIRVSGLYLGRVCHPQGYMNKDISAEPYFKKLCGERIRTCGNGCWAGGDTGGWFGIQ